MTPNPRHAPEKHPPEQPKIPDPPNDGFPADEDVSLPPPDSDVLTGRHKKAETDHLGEPDSGD